MGVSVALCTRNGHRFIEAQIESILAQTQLPDELVVSDDASSDDTLVLVRATIAAHPDRVPELRILKNDRALGVTRNFEQAIRSCSHDLILLSDQDDVWAPNRVERTIEAFDDPAVVLVHSDAKLIDESGVPLGESLFDAYGVNAETLAQLAGPGAFDIFMRRNLVTGATMGIRATLAEIAVPFPGSWVHDEWLAIVAASVGRIVPIEECLIGYRQHGGNEIGAVKLNLSAKLRRLVAPGWARNATLLARARVLAERYPALGDAASTDRIAAVREKLQHEQARSALSRHRLARIMPVMREALTGRYSRFGGGLQDVARDLVQPIKPPN